MPKAADRSNNLKTKATQGGKNPTTQEDLDQEIETSIEKITPKMTIITENLIKDRMVAIKTRT